MENVYDVISGWVVYMKISFVFIKVDGRGIFLLIMLIFNVILRELTFNVNISHNYLISSTKKVHKNCNTFIPLRYHAKITYEGLLFEQKVAIAR